MAPSQALRVAVGGISLESNDFVPFSAELADFLEAGFLAEGAAVLELEPTDTEIGGALAVLRRAGVEIAPLLAARGVSSGRLSREAWTRLRDGLLEALAGAGDLDGVFVFHHGSMEAVGEDDPEGDLAVAIRRRLGRDVPVVVTC